MKDTVATSVRSPDGLSTIVECAGPSSGPGLVLIHGVLHSRLIWKRQFADPALSSLRLAAYDIRGHGEADKPLESAPYDEPKRFGDELAAVIAATQIERPILVGWSLGSRVIFAYLAAHGWSGISGVMIIGARMIMAPRTAGVPASSTLLRSCAEGLEDRIEARRAFVKECHEIGPSPDDLTDIVAATMVTPPAVLRHLIGRPLDSRDMMRRLPVPVQVVQGAKDRVCPKSFAEDILQLNPRARLSLYENSGHSPFFEEPERFNAELLAFAERCVAAKAA